MELVAPSLSPQQAERLLFSVSLGEVLPDVVTFVSNEIEELNTFGLDVRVLEFDSDQYPIGYKDVVLRCNIGLYFAIEETLMQVGEDHIASYSTIKEGKRLLEENDFFFGHHRYIDIADKKIEDIVTLPAEAGRSRERGVNRYHSFQSSYSGSFGYHKDKLIEAGGWDMAFICRHAGEDQQLGKRIIGDRVFIHEPPFWWHPEKADGWGLAKKSNLCYTHDSYMEDMFQKCRTCPYLKYVGPENNLFTTIRPILQFDPGKVQVTERWLRV